MSQKRERERILDEGENFSITRLLSRASRCPLSVVVTRWQQRNRNERERERERDEKRLLKEHYCESVRV